MYLDYSKVIFKHPRIIIKTKFNTWDRFGVLNYMRKRDYSHRHVVFRIRCWCDNASVYIGTKST